MGSDLYVSDIDLGALHSVCACVYTLLYLLTKMSSCFQCPGPPSKPTRAPPPDITQQALSGHVKSGDLPNEGQRPMTASSGSPLC